MKKKKLTFIIPTKNRPHLLKKLVADCEKKLKIINPYFLIIDASDDKNHKLNKDFMSRFKKIKIIRQKTKGIQMGCIEAINYIKTEFSSFLYDDDVLGKYVVDIYKNNLDHKNIFSFGTGIIEDINKNVAFKKIHYHEVLKEKMLESYFGKNIDKILNTNGQNASTILPVSPICTCFQTNFLKKWKKTLFNFTKNNNFRNFFFFKRDVGPDMLVYLMNIYDSKKSVKFFTPHSVKFSSHDKSISIMYGNNFLRIGYWLARICFFKNFKIKNKESRIYIYNYLIIIGIILLISNIFNFYYLKNVLKEFNKLLLINEKISFLNMLKYFYYKAKL